MHIKVSIKGNGHPYGKGSTLKGKNLPMGANSFLFIKKIPFQKGFSRSTLYLFKIEFLQYLFKYWIYEKYAPDGSFSGERPPTSQKNFLSPAMSE